jgi:SAM-dependent methyltransferase
MKKIFDIINYYGFFSIKLFLYEFFFILLGYRGHSIITKNDKKITDTVPCPYFFLYKIFNFIQYKNISSLIDLGCGNGRVLYFFNKKKKIKYTGLEIRPHAYRIAINHFKKDKNVKIINKDFFKFPLKQLKYDCYFINDPLKKTSDHDNLVKRIIQANKHKKQAYYFILVNVSRNKLNIFNKLELIKSFRIKDRGFYIYSSNKLTN